MEHLLAAAERLTVDLIAQPPIGVDPTRQSPAEAADKAVQERYDVLPIVESDGRIVKYVRRQVLENHRADADWTYVSLCEILPDDLATATTPLLDLLGRFTRERPRLFVLGRHGVDGIVTVFDLNQPAAHQFGFGLALVVEAELSREIEGAAAISGGESDTDVDDGIYRRIQGLGRERHKDIRSRAAAWRSKIDAGEQLRLTNELVFADKILLVKKMRLGQTLGDRVSAPHGPHVSRFFAAVEQVRALRNAVAHDREELANEWKVYKWMQTTMQLARDLRAGADDGDVVAS